MEDYLNRLIDRISFYKNSTYQVDSHLKEFIKFRKKSLTQCSSENSAIPILASRLIYRNVITSEYEIKNSRLINLVNIEEKTQEIMHNYCNFCISQSFEAFETFLKDILAYYIFSNPEFFSKSEKLKDITITDYATTRIDIQKLFRKNNKYNKQIFKWLYKINNDIYKLETQNVLNFNFVEWNVVLTEIRHSIVHSSSYFEIDKTKNWTDFQIKLLDRFFTKESKEKYIIISTYKNYGSILEIIAQHAQLICDKIIIKTKRK